MAAVEEFLWPRVYRADDGRPNGEQAERSNVRSNVKSRHNYGSHADAFSIVRQMHTKIWPQAIMLTPFRASNWAATGLAGCGSDGQGRAIITGRPGCCWQAAAGSGLRRSHRYVPLSLRLTVSPHQWVAGTAAAVGRPQAGADNVKVPVLLAKRAQANPYAWQALRAGCAGPPARLRTSRSRRPGERRGAARRRKPRRRQQHR